MNQLVVDIWPMVVTAAIAAIGTYIGFIHRLRIKVSVMEVEVAELKRRVEGHSKRQDDILNAINGINTNVTDKLNTIVVDIAKIKTTLSIIEPNKELEYGRAERG
jgi:hypothetical protein